MDTGGKISRRGLFGMVAAAAAAPMLPTSVAPSAPETPARASQIDIVMRLDGRKIAEAVVPYLPEMIRRQGLT